MAILVRSAANVIDMNIIVLHSNIDRISGFSCVFIQVRPRLSAFRFEKASQGLRARRNNMCVYRCVFLLMLLRSLFHTTNILLLSFYITSLSIMSYMAIVA